MTSTGPSECKPMRTERHITFTFALTFRSSFASLSVSQPNASTSVNRDVNVNVNAKVSASANVGINVLRMQAICCNPLHPPTPPPSTHAPYSHTTIVHIVGKSATLPERLVGAQDLTLEYTSN